MVGQSAFLDQRACRFAQGKEVQLGGGTKDGRGGGMLGDVEVEDTAAVVDEHDEDEEDAQAGGGHGEEIDGHQVADIGEKRSPGLRRRGAPGWSDRETVRSATVVPSFRSSPWICGAVVSKYSAQLPGRGEAR
jgi:hypothetical protein